MADSGSVNTTENNNVPSQGFNPLDESINEKSYTTPNITLTDQERTLPLPEASTTFTPPPNQPPPGAKAGPTPGPRPQPQEPFNPQLGDLPKKDKHTAAEKAADMCISGYEFLHDIGNKQLLFSDKKLKKMQQNGDIDLSIPIAYEKGEVITIGEFIQEYNEQAKDVLVVSQEFKEEVRPVLVRVLEKKGIGATDEQQLGFIVLKDLTVKLVTGVSMYSALRSFTSTIKEHTQAYKSQYGPRPQPSYSSPAAGGGADPSPAQNYQASDNTTSNPSSGEPEVVYEKEVETTEYVADFLDEKQTQNIQTGFMQQETDNGGIHVPTVNEFVENMTNPDRVGLVVPTEQQPKRRAGRPPGSSKK